MIDFLDLPGMFEFEKLIIGAKITDPVLIKKLTEHSNISVEELTIKDKLFSKLSHCETVELISNLNLKKIIILIKPLSDFATSKD